MRIWGGITYDRGLVTRDSAAPISPWPELSAAGGRRGSDQRYSTNPPQFSATIQIIFNQVKVVVGSIEEKVSDDAMEKLLYELFQKQTGEFYQPEWFKR